MFADRRLRLHLFPTSRLGLRSFGLLGLCVTGFAVFYLLIVAGSAVGAAAVGLFAVIRRHERGLLIPIPIGVPGDDRARRYSHPANEGPRP